MEDRALPRVALARSLTRRLGLVLRAVGDTRAVPSFEPRDRFDGRFARPMRRPRLALITLLPRVEDDVDCGFLAFAVVLDRHLVAHLLVVDVVGQVLERLHRLVVDHRYYIADAGAGARGAAFDAGL